MLPREGIEALLDCARTLGLFVLLEAFDEADIEAMHDVIGSTSRYGAGQHTAAAPVLAGLNCRDLATLQIVPERLVELAPLLPANVPRVAESGVASPDDAARVAAAGYEYALVGSALMQGGDPHALAAAMLKAGRENARRDGAGAPIATSADAQLVPPVAGRGS
jgi:indole-3-glycerol phosphate synthase